MRLHHAQAELAHVTRVATLGEMTASIAHEINQPLAAVVNNANACSALACGATPNLDEARHACSAHHPRRQSGGRSDRRGFAPSPRKLDTEKVRLDINETIHEVISLWCKAKHAETEWRYEWTWLADVPPVFWAIESSYSK